MTSSDFVLRSRVPANGGIIATAVVVAVLWLGIKLVTAAAVSPEHSGRALLKQTLKRRGVDVSRIPDAAIDEIVKQSISGAKGIASYSNKANDRNWRANLVRQLDGQATIISLIISGDRSPLASSGPTRDILARYGVIKDV